MSQPHRTVCRAVAVVAAAALVLAGCRTTPSSDGQLAAPSTRDPSPSASPSVRPTPTPTATPTPYEPRHFEPAAYDAWLTEIPDNLQVDGQLPEDGGDFTRSRRGVDFRFCEEDAFSSVEVLDRSSASASGPEYGEGRDLRVFADDRTAHRFQRRVLAVLDTCPEQVMSSTRWLHQVRPSALGGDESFTVVQTFENDGLMTLGANFWEVVRVGNAVLLTATGGEYEPTTNLDPGIRSHVGDVAPIVEEMCVFAADPCDRPPVNGTSTQTPVVGPQGLGGIALGDDEGTIEGIGGRVTARRSAAGCRIVDLWVNDAPDLVGNLEPSLGLSVVYVRTAGRTDRGVGIGSPFREVVAAYPDGERDRQLYASGVAGYDDRHWRFWFDRDGLVDEFMLLLDDQHCGG